MNPYTFYSDQVRNTKEIIIGSCDLPVIIKLPDSKIKKTTYELFEEKRRECEPFTGNDATEWGHELEPLLLSHFIRSRTNRKTAHEFKVDYILHEDYRYPGYEPPTLYHPFTECRHPKLPWAVAHADCTYNDGNITWTTATIDEKEYTCPVFNNTKISYLIEAKTGGYFARVKREGVEGFDLEDHSANGVPGDILLQVQWQMLVYNVPLTYVLLLVDDNKFHVYEVPAIFKWWPLMLEKASRFYNCCITGEKPQPETFDDVKKLLPEVFDRATYITGDRAIIAEEMKAEKKSLQAKIKKYNDRIDDINDAAGLLMGDNKYLYNGETTEKIFQQVISKDQYSLIHPSTIEKQAPEEFKSLVQKGLIKKYDRRYVL
ncbi:MAG: hypothetical protein PHS93_08060 [Candidatus Omnitrophica bacterium]|nr:hypothetical protein [Candidatus Omnitrophota bacterium]MDD5353096.1 hypothetical protein [Candidatus Omnitrophota bacterium]